jgi:isoleucyl-tRNA synthetase
MLVSVGVSGQAPYKGVLSTGWVLDPQGRAMHKSLGNVVDPLKVMESSGADILRLWVASEDATADLSVGDGILKTVSDNYRRLRNTFRWLLGSLDGFDPAKDSVPLEQLQPLDRWLLARQAQVIDQVTASMEAYELHKAFSYLTNFCAGELSSLVFDVHKDTLYTLGARDPKRLSAQTALYEVLQALLRLSAPVLAFTAEEAWAQLPASFKGGVESVHFSAWPKARPEWRHPEIEEELGQLVDLVRPNVSKRLEEARAAKAIGHPYDAAITLSVRSKKIFRLLTKHQALLPQLFIVSSVTIGQAAPQDGLQMAPEEVKVEASAHEKCPRCWRRPGDVKADAVCGRCEEALKA